jgi:hypothetical protein
MTYDGAELRVYLNRTLEASSYTVDGIVTSDEPLYFGAERSWWHFTGWLDEISLYSLALSAEELGAIYAAGSSGKCPRVPVIVSPPRSQVAHWGADITFTVTARGEPPLYYYWCKDGNPIQILGAGSLMLTNIQATDAGVYSAIVSNRNGTATSGSAILTVNPYGVSLDLYAGLTINGMVGATYGIQASTNLGDPLGWRGVTNVTLSSSEQLWLDSQPATHSRRFYRVLPGPISIP